MSLPLTRILARSISWLPLRLNQSLGALIGLLAWLSRGRLRRITEINLDLCFPDMNDRERRNLCRRSLMETGKQLTECAWIWHRPFEQVERLIVEIPGEELINQALENGKGCLFISPHLGNWELCSVPLSQRAPFTYFYRSPRQSALADTLVRWRGHLKGSPATLDAAGIRNSLKILRSGGIIGILPDQEPDLLNGVYAPFFGQPALTMTLLSRLAQRADATTLFCVAERLPRGQGWRFHILPTDPAVNESDLKKATEALNQGVERCIAICPEQYLWSYKRFNTPQGGGKRPYS